MTNSTKTTYLQISLLPKSHGTLRGTILVHKTSLVPLLCFIAVSVLNRETERSRMWDRDIGFACVDFPIGFWGCSDSVVFWNCSDSVVFWNCFDSVVFCSQCYYLFTIHLFLYWWNRWNFELMQCFARVIPPILFWYPGTISGRWCIV
jgi:hypothetical protein